MNLQKSQCGPKQGHMTISSNKNYSGSLSCSFMAMENHPIALAATGPARPPPPPTPRLVASVRAHDPSILCFSGLFQVVSLSVCGCLLRICCCSPEDPHPLPAFSLQRMPHYTLPSHIHTTQVTISNDMSTLSCFCDPPNPPSKSAGLVRQPQGSLTERRCGQPKEYDEYAAGGRHASTENPCTSGVSCMHREKHRAAAAVACCRSSLNVTLCVCGPQLKDPRSTHTITTHTTTRGEQESQLHMHTRMCQPNPTGSMWCQGTEARRHTIDRGRLR